MGLSDLIEKTGYKVTAVSGVFLGGIVAFFNHSEYILPMMNFFHPSNQAVSRITFAVKSLDELAIGVGTGLAIYGGNKLYRRIKQKAPKNY